MCGKFLILHYVKFKVLNPNQFKSMRVFILHIALLATLCAGNLHAQSLPVAGTLPKFDFGAKLGANFAKFGGDNWEKTYKPGIVGGIILGVHKHKIGVQAEVLLNSAHYNLTGIKDSVGNGEFRALYLDIPVLFEYKVVGAALAPKVWVMAGPQFSNLMSVKSLNDFKGDAKNTFKSGSFSAVLGAEVRFLKLSVGGRYILGLTDVNNASISSAKDAWKANSFQLYIGLRLI